jgi:hypothetical protein
MQASGTEHLVRNSGIRALDVSTIMMFIWVHAILSPSHPPATSSGGHGYPCIMSWRGKTSTVGSEAAVVTAEIPDKE